MTNKYTDTRGHAAQVRFKREFFGFAGRPADFLQTSCRLGRRGAGTNNRRRDILGSLGGAIIGLPVPIIGSAVAAIFGGAMGAFAGAILGEQWKGRSWEKRMEVGRAAFFGRIFGTVGKLAIGAIMVVIATVDSFV